MRTQAKGKTMKKKEGIGFVGLGQVGDLGIEAAPLSCEEYTLAPQHLADFRACFAERIR